MEIHILLAGVEIGPFSEKQVRQHLADGLISPSDPSKHEGMKDWEPVDVVLARLTAPAVPPPVPAATSLAPATAAPPPSAPPPIPERTIHSGPPRAILPGAIKLQGNSSTAPSTTPPSPAPDDATTSAATQRLKRKPTKIVIQPILPLSSTSSTAGKGETTASGPADSESSPDESVTKTMMPVKAVLPGRPPPLHKEPEKKNPPPLEPAIPAKAVTGPRPPPLPVQWPEPVPELPPASQRPLAIYIGAAIGVIAIALIIFFVFLEGHGGTKQDDSTHSPTAAAVNSDADILAVTPHTADEFNKQGAARQAKGDLDGAISDYDQAINLEPNNVVAFYGRGLAQRAKQNWNAALADFNQALVLDPRHAETYSNRGFVKQCLGDLDGAIADYTQALFINPKIVTAYYNRALIKGQRGDADGAIIDYSEALAVDPKISLAYYNRGRLKAQKGDYDGAILDFNKTLELDPSMPEAFYYRGNAKSAEGNLDGAIADFTQALALNPKIAVAYGYRGSARQSKGDLAGALDDYSQALALNPKMAAIYYNRGLIKEQKGDLTGAIADSTQALQLNPKDAQSYCNRGLAKLGLGDFDGALVDLRTFCELAPRDDDADYARLYLWLISTKQNPQGHADHDLIAAVTNDWNSTPDSLATKIAKFLLGHASESDVLAVANDQTQDPAMRCKAWYFAGMKRMLAGQKSIAIDYLNKAVSTGKPEDCEYMFAQQELQELGQKPQSPPAP